MFFGYSREACAATISDVQKEQEETQEQLDEVNDRMEGMEQQKDTVEGEITVLDTQLIEILTSISVCEDEIDAKEEEIKLVKVELEEAQQREQNQYADMKTRIRFMYETGDQTYLQIFMEASSIADILNKASYVEQLYEYDRELLLEYEETKEEVAGIKEELELEEADLLTSQKELKEQQDYLENLIAEKRATVANFDAQLAQAQEEANSYKQQLKKQNEEIQRLEEEERKAKEKEQQDAENTLLTSNSKENETQSTGSTTNAQSSETGSTEGNQTENDAGNSTENTVAEKETTTSTDTGSGLGTQIANYGCQFIGYPYVYGGTSLTNGTDCSGFTQAVYAHFGISIPRDSTSQRFAGTGVSYEDARPGDIICYAGHVALYIGNGQIVHASTERTGIKISNATYRTILAVRRIVN
jgi:cell wall-associated NlpC family hydrolase